MAQADVFLFPSCEAGGMVVLEALAQGLPVVCLAYGGPGKMVTPECGFVVEPGPGAAQGLADGMNNLASDPELLQRMSHAARRRIRERYLWERRHEAIRQWYNAAGLATTVRMPAQTDHAAQVGQGDSHRIDLD